jgi:hypothetical protein
VIRSRNITRSGLVPGRAGARASTGAEVDFCARLRTWAEGLGFVVYPEVQGWDLVLVAEAAKELYTEHGRRESNPMTVRAGHQLAIHAKLRPSFEVLEQACKGWQGGPGPAYPFVAVPGQPGDGFLSIARRLHVGVLGELAGPVVMVELYHAQDRLPLALPPIATRHIAAGAPSPRVLSPWRVKALRFLAFARARGVEPIFASDVKGHGLSKDWVDKWLLGIGWAYVDNPRAGARGAPAVVKVRTYRLIQHSPEALPDFGYEDVAAELAAAAGEAA